MNQPEIKRALECIAELRSLHSDFGIAYSIAQDAANTFEALLKYMHAEKSEPAAWRKHCSSKRRAHWWALSTQKPNEDGWEPLFAADPYRDTIAKGESE